MRNPPFHTALRQAFPGKLLLLCAYAAMITLAGGCAVWNFVDTRYQNVTGYFNSYYNASRLYNAAMDDLEAEKLTQALQPMQSLDDIPRLEGMPPDGGRPGGSGGGSDMSDGATTPDGMVITRDGDQIETVTPDAGGRGAGGRDGGMRPMTPPTIKMPMSAPSNAVIGLDKVIAKCSRILVSYPKSRWVDDALLMIGVSYFYKMEYVKAETKFKELLSSFPGTSLYSEGVLWLGKTFYAAERFEDAESYLLQAIERGTADDEADIVAEAWYTLGEMALARRKPSAAIECFQKGADAAEHSDLRFRLYLELARQEELYGDKEKAAEAYADIISMEPGAKLAFTAELNYARLSREAKRYDDAANTLIDMLDNPGYMDYDGDIQLEIGHLYVDMGEFSAAKDQYTYVDTTFKNQQVSAEASYALGRLYEKEGRNYDKAYDSYDKSRAAYPGCSAAKAGGKRAQQLGDYRRMRNRMFDVDTLLFYVLHPDSLAQRDSVRAVADSIARQTSEAKAAQADAQRQLERLSRRRPHGRNTGKVTLASLEPAAAGQPTPSVAGGAFTNPTGSLPLYRKLKLSEVSPDSLLQVLSGMRIEMGWTMFDKIGDVDSALFYYNLALGGTLPDSLRAYAYYSLAGIGRQIGDTAMTNGYEQLLITVFPASPYARGLMLARGMYVPKDSTVIAREAYERAALILEQGRFEEGITAMRAMAAAYPNSDQAARAKLAVAMTYEMPLDQGAKALELYRALVAEHPSSQYSQRGRDILAAIEAASTNVQKKEAEAKKQAEEEALRKQKEEEEKKKEKERPLRRLLLEDQREIDSIKAAQKKAADPTQDPDFPLNLPGETKPGDTGAQKDQAPGGQQQTPPAGQGRPQTPPAGQQQEEVPVTPLGGGAEDSPPPGKGK